MTTLSIYDITCTLFITSHALYMTSHLLCMMSHSLCLLLHTMTLPMTSNTISLWHIHLIWHHAQCYEKTAIVCLHSHYAWHYTQCMFDILWPTVYMTTHPFYACHLMQSTEHHTSSLWLHTIVIITLYPLNSWHQTPYIWHHTLGNTNDISAIWNTIFNTTSTVSVSSNPGYQLYHNHFLYDITHTIRVTSYSVCMLSQQLFSTLHTSIYNFTPSIFMTSYPICTL